MDYIEYLRKMIAQEEEALGVAQSQGYGKEVQDFIQRRLESCRADLEDYTALTLSLHGRAIKFEDGERVLDTILTAMEIAKLNKGDYRKLTLLVNPDFTPPQKK